MTLPASRYIAPHLREHIFRSYEDFVRQAVDAWPDETYFTVPPDIAPATFVANMRNALVSLDRYQWKTSIDVPKLTEMSSPRRVYTITYDSTNNRVLFRHARKPEPRAFSPTVAEVSTERGLVVPSAPASVVPWRDCTDADLDALCLLIDKQRLTGPFFVDGSVRPEFVEHLQTIFNVALVYDAERNVTIIT